VGPLRAGGVRVQPLRGVAAPAGRHVVFDEAGAPHETPASRARRQPTHTRFDDDGRPLPAAGAQAPRWR
jgi:hypothetical protein